MIDGMFLLAVSTVVWSYLFIQGVCLLNHMSKRTPLSQRLGYVVFTVSSFALLIGPFFCIATISWAEVGIGLGLALFRSHRLLLVWRKRYHQAVLKARRYVHRHPV